VNPLLVGSQGAGAVAVDALVVLSAAAASAGAADTGRDANRDYVGYAYQRYGEFVLDGSPLWSDNL
jgi:hypothetical protein